MTSPQPTGMAVRPAYSGGRQWPVLDNTVVGLVAAHVMPPEARPAGPFRTAHSTWPGAAVVAGEPGRPPDA